MNWREVLDDQKPKLDLIQSTLDKERELYEVLPPQEHTFAALRATPFEAVKVVILGMDPYQTPGAAHGLSFSILPGRPIQPGARNIIKELSSDVGCPTPNNFYLRPWTEQGVLLLNSILTVRAGISGSHRGIGWTDFTDAIIARVSAYHLFVVFILWGKDAISKRSLISDAHGVITSSHPSPYTAEKSFGPTMPAFFGSKPFSRANALLQEHGLDPIHWCVPKIPEGR